MTDFPAANEAFYQFFADVWTPTGFPFAFENEKFDETPNQPWARAVVRHNAASQDTLGRRLNRRFERLGAMFIQIFVPLKEGTARSKQLVQVISNGFEGERITGTTICFNDVIPREVPPTADWYQVTIEAQFRYSEIK